MGKPYSFSTFLFFIKFMTFYRFLNYSFSGKNASRKTLHFHTGTGAVMQNRAKRIVNKWDLRKVLI